MMKCQAYDICDPCAIPAFTNIFQTFEFIYDGMLEIFCNCLSILTKDETMVHVDIFISICILWREKQKKTQKKKIHKHIKKSENEFVKKYW